MSKNKLSRRRFFKRCAAGASLTLLPSPVPAASSFQPPGSSSTPSYPPGPVIIARSDRLKTKSGNPDTSEIRRLLGQAMVTITGKETPAEAWRSLFNSRDIVALKVNCLSRGIATNTQVTEAVVEGLRSVGIPAQNILIWERSSSELRDAGYRIAAGRGGGGLGGARCFGTDAVAGGGYEREPEIIGEVGSCFSQVITRYCTALINVPVLKDHDLAGVSVALKNNYGVIHNPNRYHDNNCDPYVAHLNSISYLINKQRLVICDAITAQCHGGPAHKSSWTWGFGGLLVSTDPVALDTVGADIIERRRKEVGLPSLLEAKRPPRWLDTAHSMGLGVGKLSSITVKEIG